MYVVFFFAHRVLSHVPSTDTTSDTAVNGGGVNGKETTLTRALLYTATTDNPNFYLSPTLEETAATIASAVGPSGPNREYLFFLSEYLEKVGQFGGEGGGGV